jgi:sugar/nucleoside kinase (ribokinase family)
VQIGIASHIVLDTIMGPDGVTTESIGGPPCYAGIVCRRFGIDVLLATKVGRDLADKIRLALSDHKIRIPETCVSDEPTTRFSIVSEDHSRQMILQSKCTPISAGDVENMDVDGWLVSPVYDEVPEDVFDAIKSNRGNKDFVMLDPQGYMRSADSEGRISILDGISIDLSGVRAIKVDQQEMSAITGGLQGIDGMRSLQAMGVEFIVSTIPNEIHLLHKDVHYWAKLKRVETTDATGAGDIIAGAFCGAYLKERDPLWALCFGAGALQAALESRMSGTAKVTNYSIIEENASYFYNTVGFRKLS